MTSPATLPIEARQAAWRALWKRLLAPIPDDSDRENQPDQDRDLDEEAERHIDVLIARGVAVGRVAS
jgi:hypothetical protein